MKKIVLHAPVTVIVVVAALGIGVAIGAAGSSGRGAVLPAKIDKADMQGRIFERPETIETSHDGRTVLDVTTLKSSDGKFASGMYRAGKSRFEVQDPYGVDEFMVFLEGGVTLTSADGSVQVVGAGEAVTIPKEWTGTWETDGYTKIWVIYSEDGSGL